MGTPQTKSVSPATPSVFSTSNLFATFSQAVKDDSSLVVMPSSIPNFATERPDADLSSNESFKEVLEDFEDKPITKKRVSNSDEDDDSNHETEAVGMCFLPLLDLLSFLLLLFFYFFGNFSK